MRIPKIIIDSTDYHTTGSDIAVTGQNFHHLSRVLRCEIGDTIEIFFQNAQAFRAVISQIGTESLSVKLLQEKTTPATKNITLICGYPKPTTAEFIVEKAVEIGISELHFFFADRSQTRLQGEQLSKKLARLEKIKDSALKQSGLVGQITKLCYHNSLKDTLSQPADNQDNSRLKMIFVPPDEAPHSSNAAELVQSKSQTDSYTIIVGPEGGLCEQEIELAKSYGFTEASLGNKILRVETAVIASGMLIQLL